MNAIFGKDIVTVEQFTKNDIKLIFDTASRMRKTVEKRGGNEQLKNKVMTALFYEPSSRTFGSFIAAMQRLGGGIIPLQGITYSSVAKGETLADTVRTFANYSDVIVIRHPEVGSARIAAEFSPKPIINAGDGIGEHPTQALLDLFTISHHYKKFTGLTVSMIGDLLNGRTIHSLSKLLSLFKNITINLVSPEILRLPGEIFKKLESRGLKLNITEKITDVLGTTDVFYITRVQKERFTDIEMYERLKHHYIITPTLLRGAKKTAIVMHPLPRVGEITMDVDLDKRAVYITEQMVNGMYVRMALLSLILTK